MGQFFNYDLFCACIELYTNWIQIFFAYQELMVFSAQMHRMAEKKLKFERLVVDAAFALEMFKDNQYKSAQVVLLIFS